MADEEEEASVGEIMHTMQDGRHHFTYEITNLITGEFYLGVHSTDDIEDGYMGSSVYLSRDINKLGAENFSRSILKTFDTRKEALFNECEIITKRLVECEFCYNLMYCKYPLPPLPRHKGVKPLKVYKVKRQYTRNSGNINNLIRRALKIKRSSYVRMENT